jgi:DNA-binding NtrC family response regulator
MNTPLRPSTDVESFSPQFHPSILIVEPDPRFVEALPLALRRALPDVVFDVCVSREEGLSRIHAGNYHAVVSDARLAEDDDFLLLKAAQRLSCPVPLLVSEKGEGNVQVFSGLIEHGAFDILRCLSSHVDASFVLKPALWLYRLRVTIHERRRNLEALRERRKNAETNASAQRMAVLDKAIHDIGQINRLCERTHEQIESSLRVLEKASRQLESSAMEHAMRTVRLLEDAPSPSI